MRLSYDANSNPGSRQLRDGTSIAFSYDAASKWLKMGTKTAQLHPGQTVDARFLIDHGIVESFWNGGEEYWLEYVYGRRARQANIDRSTRYDVRWRWSGNPVSSLIRASGWNHGQ